MSSLIFLSYVLTCACLIQFVYPSCSELGYCNGNGICKQSTCECFEGWGAKTDITKYRSPDCSARTCPSDISWGDVPSYTGDNHRIAECSDKGTCNRVTGKCKCSEGFEGAACQRLKCLNNCSGHGRCMTLERLASEPTAFPLSDPSTYEGSNVRINCSLNFIQYLQKVALVSYLFIFLLCFSVARARRRGTLARLSRVFVNLPGRWASVPTKPRRRSGSVQTALCVRIILNCIAPFQTFSNLSVSYVCMLFWRRSMPICG
jgi:hypothetical protein